MFKEDENRKQRLIFFVSKSIFEAETRYTCLEQTALALRVVAKKLCPYFSTSILLGFSASNNETEYEAILVGIDLAISMSLENIIIQSDSQLVVGQVNGEYEARDKCMDKYVSLVKIRLGSFMV